MSAAGFPAATPVAVDGPDLVLERLHGPTLLQSLAAGETRLSAGVQILVDLHTRLHAVTPPADAEPGQVGGHLDLHPANIVLTETQGPALIDWTAAALGDPDLDLAVTALDDAIRSRLSTRVLDQDERALLPAAAEFVRQVLLA